MDQQRREKILDTVSKLRVTDIRDGMDWMGMHHQGTVSPEIRPLWRTKAAGFARTCRHMPTQQSVPDVKGDDYTKWAYEYWYGKVSLVTKTTGTWIKFYDLEEGGSFISEEKHMLPPDEYYDRWMLVEQMAAGSVSE